MIYATLRCATKCESGSSRRDGGWQVQVTFVPDYELTAEPSVLLQLTISPDAAEEFEPGRRYILHLVPVDDS